MSDELIVSFSELDAYRHCPFKWMLSYEQRWQKAPAAMSPLDKGTAWHTIMEVHYNVIQAHQVAVDGAVPRVEWRNSAGLKVSAAYLTQRCRDAVDAELARLVRMALITPELVRLLDWMYAGHLAVYGLDESFDIVSVESTHMVPLGTIYTANGVASVVLKFKADVLVRDKHNQLKVVDHKSCGNLPSGMDLDMTDQFPLYQKGFRLLGLNVRGGIHSAARATQNQGDIFKPGDPDYKKSMKAQTLDERFRRTPLQYTDQQLETVWAEALATVRQMYGPANERERHPDPVGCKRKCSFLEQCLFGRRTGKVSDTIRMLENTGFTQEFTRH